MGQSPNHEVVKAHTNTKGPTIISLDDLQHQYDEISQRLRAGESFVIKDHNGVIGRLTPTGQTGPSIEMSFLERLLGDDLIQPTRDDFIAIMESMGRGGCLASTSRFMEEPDLTEAMVKLVCKIAGKDFKQLWRINEKTSK